MERSQPTSAPVVCFINHAVTGSDTWRLFISLLHPGATTTISAAAAENIWKRLLGGPPQARKDDTSFTFTSTEATGAERTDEGPADAQEERKQTASCLSSNRHQDISDNNHIILC